MKSVMYLQIWRPNLVIPWAICFWWKGPTWKKTTITQIWWKLFEICIFISTMRMNFYLYMSYVWKHTFFQSHVLFWNTQSAVENLPQRSLKKLDIELLYDPEIPLLNWKQVLKQYMCVHVRSSTTHQRQKVEATQMSMSGRMSKQIMIYTYNDIFSHKQDLAWWILG